MILICFRCKLGYSGPNCGIPIKNGYSPNIPDNKSLHRDPISAPPSKIDVLEPVLKIVPSTSDSFHQNEPIDSFGAETSRLVKVVGQSKSLRVNLVQSRASKDVVQSETLNFDEPSVYLLVGAAFSLFLIFLFASFILVYSRNKKILVETRVGCHGYHETHAGSAVQRMHQSGDAQNFLMMSFSGDHDVNKQLMGDRFAGTRHRNEQLVAMETGVVGKNLAHCNTRNPLMVARENLQNSETNIHEPDRQNLHQN